jgi:cold shock CspA family protein
VPQGTIKDYDKSEGTGALLTDDRAEVAIDRTSTEGSGILTLRLGQRVRFEVADADGRAVARKLRLVTFDEKSSQ